MGGDDADPVLVIGVGNQMRRDDGVGVETVARMQAAVGNRVDSPVQFRTLDGEPARLIEAWRGRGRVVVIDAARAGSHVGDIHRIEVGVDALPDWASVASSHSAGLAEAIALARALDALPGRLTIFGVEPGELSMGEGLSDNVDAAVTELVDRIMVDVLS